MACGTSRITEVIPALDDVSYVIIFMVPLLDGKRCMVLDMVPTLDGVWHMVNGAVPALSEEVVVQSSLAWFSGFPVIFLQIVLSSYGILSQPVSAVTRIFTLT